MRAKPLGLFTRAKSASYDWLSLHVPGISETGNVLKITSEGSEINSVIIYSLLLLTCLMMLNPRRAAFLATDLVKGVARFGRSLSSPFGFLKDALQLLRSLPKEHKDNGRFFWYSLWELIVKSSSYLMASRMHLNQVSASVLDLEYKSSDLSLQVTWRLKKRDQKCWTHKEKNKKKQFDACTCISRCPRFPSRLTLNRAPAPELSSFSVKPPKTCSNSQSISGKTRRHKYELRITHTWQTC